MQRPTKFEHFRYLGDRRKQVVYDLDELEDASIIERLMAAPDNDGLNGVPYTCFSPDTLAEARNRGYRPYKGNGSGRYDDE